MSKKYSLSLNNIGLATFCLYIFMSYNAVDILIPNKFAQLSLYLFLGVGVLAFFEGIFQIKLRKFISWYLLLMIYSMFTMLYSPENSIINSEYYYMIIAVVISFFALIFIKTERHLIAVFWCFSLSSFALCIVLAVQGLLVGDEGHRLGGELFGNSNTFAWLIMLAVFCQIWLLVFETKKIRTKIILLFATILNIYALSLSGGRKYFVVPFLFLYILSIMKKDQNGKKHTIRNTVIIGAIILLVYYLVMNVEVLYNSVGVRLERLVEGYVGEGQLDGSADIRGRMQIYALQGWLDSPLIGNGFDSFKYYSSDVLGAFAYSHCNYTELLYNGGIVGFIIYYYYYFYILGTAIKNKDIQTKYRALAVATIISILIFEYGCVTYSTAIHILFIALVEKNLVFEKEMGVCQINGENKNVTLLNLSKSEEDSYSDSE